MVVVCLQAPSFSLGAQLTSSRVCAWRVRDEAIIDFPPPSRCRIRMKFLAPLTTEKSNLDENMARKRSRFGEKTGKHDDKQMGHSSQDRMLWNNLVPWMVPSGPYRDPLP